MAVRISNVKCERCGKAKNTSHGSGRPAPSICGDCEGEVASAARQVHLNRLSVLPLRARLALIEARLYDDAMNPKADHFDGLIG